MAGAVSSAAATTTTTQVHHRKSTRLHSTHHVTHHATVTSTRLVRGRDGKLHRVAVRHRYYEHFTGNSFSDNVSNGDVTLGEDPVVRAAAVEALGNMNGTVVAIDPNSGRVLAMVNQNLALEQRRRTLLHDQGFGRTGSIAGRHHHQGHAG